MTTTPEQIRAVFDEGYFEHWGQPLKLASIINQAVAYGLVSGRTDIPGQRWILVSENNAQNLETLFKDASTWDDMIDRLLNVYAERNRDQVISAGLYGHIRVTNVTQQRLQDFARESGDADASWTTIIDTLLRIADEQKLVLQAQAEAPDEPSFSEDEDLNAEIDRIRDEKIDTLIASLASLKTQVEILTRNAGADWKTWNSACTDLTRQISELSGEIGCVRRSAEEHLATSEMAMSERLGAIERRLDSMRIIYNSRPQPRQAPGSGVAWQL